MERKGIGPQGLGHKGNKGYWIGSGSETPFKMKDLSGDGKITKKDVLIGRGVIDEKGSPLQQKCWPGYKAEGKKKSPSGKKTKGGKTKMVNNCVKK
jgi:hypothetical protein